MKSRQQTIIPAGEFKTKCLQLMDRVQKQHQEILITKRGNPVAKLVPVEHVAINLFGYLAGTIEIKGDLITPIDVKWEANE